MDDELVEIKLQQVDLSVWVRMAPEKAGPHILEALKLLDELKKSFGPNNILEQLGVLLSGKVESVEIRNCAEVAVDRAELGEYIPKSLSWARGKRLAELDPSLLQYAVDMGEVGVDTEAIVRYLKSIDYSRLVSNSSDNFGLDDDEIPF